MNVYEVVFEAYDRIFHSRLTSGGEIFNNRLLFSGNLCGEGQGCDGGEQSHDGGTPQSHPLLGKLCMKWHNCKMLK